MENTVRVVNEILVELFNDILRIEKTALQTSPFSDLSITEMHVIEKIGQTPRTMTDVADELGVTVGTLTTSINRLVKKEYVSRERSREDKRFVEIALTHKGRLAFRVHEAFHQEMVKVMIKELAQEDHSVLIESLTNLNKFFKDKYHETKKV